MSALLRALPDLPWAVDPGPAGRLSLRAAAPPPQVRLVVNADAGRVKRWGVGRVERLARNALGDALAELIVVRRCEVTDAIAGVAAAEPQVLAVLGGDGTARAALERAGPRTAVAPLPGGTLNRLPRVVFGHRALAECLRVLPKGCSRTLPAARIGDRRFFAVAGFGPIMALETVREAVRDGLGLAEAWRRFRSVGSDAFQPRLHWRAGRAGGASSAIVCAIGPADSALGLAPPGWRTSMETVGADLRGWGDLFRLSGDVLARRWRQRRGVSRAWTDQVEIRGEGEVLALLDGEPRLLPQAFCVTFEPNAARAWGPADAAEGRGGWSGFSKAIVDSGPIPGRVSMRFSSS